MRYLIEFTGFIESIELWHFLERVEEYPLDNQEWVLGHRFISLRYKFYIPEEDFDEIESLLPLFGDGRMVVDDLCI